MKNKNVVIKKDPENEVSIEIFEQAIVDVAAGFKKFNSSRLTKRAIVLLIQDYCGGIGRIGRVDVESVLDAAANLDKRYLK